MNKSKIGNIINILFVILVFVGLVVYLLAVDGIENVVQILRSVDYWWLTAGVVFTVLYWLLEGICFYVITKKMYKTQKFMSSFRLAVIGRLFNNITPFSCGDQPAQLVAMKQEGKTLSDGASILLTRFIVYQAVLVIYTLIISALQYNYFVQLLGKYMYLAGLGLAINSLVIVFLIALVINEKLIFSIVKGVIKILGKLKIVKDVENNLIKFKEVVSEFHDQIVLIKKEKMMIFKVALYTAIEITVLYAITYIVYRAFGYNSVDFITILSAQTFLSLVTVYMPTPGAGGVAEGGFYIVFKTFFASNTISLAIIFWRLFTFYLPIIVGTIFLYKKPIITTKEEKTELNTVNAEN